MHEQPAEASTDPLLQPFSLGGLRLKNRIMSTSHAIAYQEDGKPQARYQAYHEAKARGGLALSMFGGSSNIDRDSASVFGQLYVGDDSIVPHFQAFAARLHAYGCALMCQITHLGRRSDDRGDWWLPTIGPSRSREPLHRSFCKAMDRHDIARVQAAYVAAAQRCRDGGLDGSELMAGSHLPGQFLSPFTNERRDGYGGPLANRARFLIETLDGIRTKLGADFPLGLRLPSEEPDGGIGPEETLELASMLTERGLVDFFNVYFGRMDAMHTLADNHLPGMASPGSPFLDRAAAFKAATALPVFHATRVTDVATARHAIKAGLIDMVAMTRAHIADPQLVEKIASGQEARIRPCVGATLCSTDFRVCIHNAATGSELQLPQVIEANPARRLRAVVVGGGPAGLEAARVLALRGHAVSLFEAQSTLGGQLQLAARIPWRGDLIGIRDWLAGEVDALGVELHLGVWADVDDVLALSPDVVVVATGGLPDGGDFEGAELAFDSWEVLGGKPVTGDTVLVFDETGRHAGSGVADFLAAAGKRVELISPDRCTGIELTETDTIAQRRRHAQLGVMTRCDTALTAISRDGNRLKAQCEHLLTGEPLHIGADAIVVERGSEPLSDLYEALRPGSSNDGVLDQARWVAGEAQAIPSGGGYALFRIGDAISSRGIHAAIKDALRLCARL